MRASFTFHTDNIVLKNKIVNSFMLTSLRKTPDLPKHFYVVVFNTTFRENNIHNNTIKAPSRTWILNNGLCIGYYY